MVLQQAEVGKNSAVDNQAGVGVVHLRAGTHPGKGP